VARPSVISTASALPDVAALSRFERFLGLFTRMRPGEGRSVALFFMQGFLLLFAYYIVKAQREALVLTQFSAEVRSYAVATIALVLMALMPAYTALRRRVDGERLIETVIVFFGVTLLAFCGLFAAGWRTGFAFFVWVGIFGLAVIAQFWAFAADTFNLKSGQRLFPVIMIGANLGALAGAQAAGFGAERVAPVELMLIATATLFITLAFGRPARRSVPDGSRAVAVGETRPTGHVLGGISLVFRDSYLFLIAVLVILLNWINTTGEFILAEVVAKQARTEVAAGRIASEAAFITGFYGNFQFWVTLLGLVIQLFLVARIYRLVGLRGALMIMPVIVALGYGLVVFVPVFAMIEVVKTLENSVDYTLMNTTRQALFLPVSRAAKYDGKTAIDTFFWRIGDLVQAGFVFAGVRLLGLGAYDFATLNFFLALMWILLALWIGRRYVRLASEYVLNVAPEVRRPIPDLDLRPGEAVRYTIDGDTFFDADPGDVLRLNARLVDGGDLPAWLRFDAARRHFHGIVPDDGEFVLSIEVIASDVDGSEVSSSFEVRCVRRFTAS
jgi:ATP:ADP antiporter, AAA family